MRFIDADALIDAMTKFSNAIGEDMTHGIFYAHIAPTIDAVPVIRCKDCRYFRPDDGCDQCALWEYGKTDREAFCSYAMRRGEGCTN